MLIFSLSMFATPFSDVRTLAPTILYIFTYWIKSQVCQQPPITVDALSGHPSYPAQDQRDIPILFHWGLYTSCQTTATATQILCHTWDPTKIPGCCHCLPTCNTLFILLRLQHHCLPRCWAQSFCVISRNLSYRFINISAQRCSVRWVMLLAVWFVTEKLGSI